MKYVMIIIAVLMVLMMSCAQEKSDTGPQAVKQGEVPAKEVKNDSVKPAKEKPVSPIKCDVVAVAREKDTNEITMVMLNVGAKDNIKKGNEFYIYRGKTFVCSLVVQKVFGTSAVCSIIAESVNKDRKGNKLEPKEGDKASNKIY